MSTDLKGLTVAITASRRASELAHLVAIHGGSPYLAPTVGIESSVAVASEVQEFCALVHSGKIDIAIFMTGPGVFSLLSAARDLHLEATLVEGLSKTRIVARSSKPKDALVKHGVRVDLVPNEATSDGVLESLREVAEGKTVAILSHGSDSLRLVEGLSAMGANVQQFSTYTYSIETGSTGARILGSMRFKPVMASLSRVYELIDIILEGKIDVLTFTSPPSANNLFDVASGSGKMEDVRSMLNRRVVVVAVGPPTRATIEKFGVTVDVMPSVYKMGPMMKEACDYVRGRGIVKRDDPHSPASHVP